MLRIMIAEDEIAIASLIRSLIDFEELELEFAGFAYDGQSAFEMIREEKPDIVLSDISMPGMTGMELIQKVKDEGLRTHVIIISGLTSFEYAVSAIKMGVDDYLLKPINKEELNTVLEKTVEKISRSRKLNHQFSQLRRNAQQSSRKLRQSFMINILYNEELIRDLTIESCNSEYGFSIREGDTLLMGAAAIDGIQILNLAAQNNLVSQMVRIFQTGLHTLCPDLEIYNKGSQFTFFLSYPKEQENRVLAAISSVLNDLTAFLQSRQNLRLSIACGLPADTPARLPESLDSARKALNARILAGGTQLLWAKELFANAAEPSYILTPRELDNLRSNIEIQDASRFDEALDSIFQKTAESCKTCPHLFPEAVCSVVSDILSDFYQHNLIGTNVTDLYLEFCDNMEEYVFSAELLAYAAGFIRKQIRFEENTENQEGRLIETARTYIQEHYGENLKLEDVADQVYLSSSYFGVLFKKMVGESFSSYLTTVRMEKAKELLKDLRYSVADVSYAVGYQDKRYFSKLFREQVGVTPKEFRKIYTY